QIPAKPFRNRYCGLSDCRNRRADRRRAGNAQCAAFPDVLRYDATIRAVAVSARDEILGRIRVALSDRPAAPSVTRDYRGDVGAGDVELFVERVEDYKASVHRDVPVDDVLRGR